MRVLYLSYNGLLDPLGQSQVLQYLIGLAALGHKIVLLTYEKADEWANESHREAARRATADAGIRWIPLTYHRRPSWPATGYDVAVGGIRALFLVLRHRIEIVHARGYVMAVIALLLKVVFRVRFIFDPRSFWPDERVEMGIWREGSRAHRVAKWLEQQFLANADAVVSLTASGAETMRAFPYLHGKATRFEVITTCTNLSLFHPRSSRPAEPFTLGYLGTVGTPYLLDEVFTAFLVARKLRGDARLLILNRRDHAFISEGARACGVPPEAMELKGVEHRGVVEELWRMTAGVIFITPTVCRRSCAPTKLGELLGAGVPCIANAGVGDLERILKGEGVGVIVPDFSAPALQAGVQALLRLTEESDIAERCAAVARRYFSLEQGVRAYDGLYTEVAGR